MSEICTIIETKISTDFECNQILAALRARKKAESKAFINGEVYQGPKRKPKTPRAGDILTLICQQIKDSSIIHCREIVLITDTYNNLVNKCDRERVAQIKVVGVHVYIRCTQGFFQYGRVVKGQASKFGCLVEIFAIGAKSGPTRVQDVDTAILYPYKGADLIFA